MIYVFLALSLKITSVFLLFLIYFSCTVVVLAVQSIGIPKELLKLETCGSGCSDMSDPLWTLLAVGFITLFPSHSCCLYPNHIGIGRPQWELQVATFSLETHWLYNPKDYMILQA